MKKKELKVTERKVIEILLNREESQTEIAKELGVHKSTISREVRNRSTPNGYFADIAQLNYEERRNRTGTNACKIMNSQTRNYILLHLQAGWSPEQISGRMKRDKRKDRICHETIYNFIYNESYCKREKMYQYLRRGKKRRTKWKGRGSHKSKLPNRISISQRPEIVNKRSEFGHWEGDSVIYPNKKAINTVNELKTGLVEFTKLDRKTAELTASAMTTKLSKYETKTLTLDNGTEFTNHEDVNRDTGAVIYFCHPYSSWERGANENANGLLRGYLPKRYNIDELTQEELDEIAKDINNRPRKRLGYQTPAEAYRQELSKNVAVRSRM